MQISEVFLSMLQNSFISIGLNHTNDLLWIIWKPRAARMLTCTRTCSGRPNPPHLSGDFENKPHIDTHLHEYSVDWVSDAAESGPKLKRYLYTMCMLLTNRDRRNLATCCTLTQAADSCVQDKTRSTPNSQILNLAGDTEWNLIS